MIYNTLDEDYAKLVKNRYNELWMEHLSAVKDATDKINQTFLSYINYEYPDVWLDPPNEDRLQDADTYANILSEYLIQEIEGAKKHCIEKLQRHTKQ